MGEAKRRKELGLNYKIPTRLNPNSNQNNILTKYPYLPGIVIGLIIFALIFDWTKFNVSSA